MEFTICIGKSAKENWKLIDDSMPNDIWFHLDDVPSSHVILKTSNFTFFLKKNLRGR
jgi:predicted ribosome quality control (RQC) complex YloA/Tae2 family protein